jgi:hypothetical protein
VICLNHNSQSISKRLSTQEAAFGVNIPVKIAALFVLFGICNLFAAPWIEQSGNASIISINDTGKTLAIHTLLSPIVNGEFIACRGSQTCAIEVNILAVAASFTIPKTEMFTGTILKKVSGGMIVNATIEDQGRLLQRSLNVLNTSTVCLITPANISNGSTATNVCKNVSRYVPIDISSSYKIEKGANASFQMVFYKLYSNDVIDLGWNFYGLNFNKYGWWNSSGGNLIYQDGNSTVVVYTSNGTFEVSGDTPINATVLLVAGGGGSVEFASGGGGAGGLLYNTSYNATGNITVIVGKGGGGIEFPCTVEGCNGQNSSFGTMMATGGGFGGTYQTHSSSGGSGGGGGRSNSPNTEGSAGIAGQGNAGGNGASDNCGGGGGGAGSGGSSSNCDGTNGGTGGIGINYTINGSTVCYAGGGGGGTRGGNVGIGICGGGNGGQGGAPGTNGVDGLGGGAGGSGSPGKRGGDGIVIVRYLTYVPPMGNLTVNSTVGGTATGNNSTFSPPANLTINATAATDYSFVNWTTNCNGSVDNQTSKNTKIAVLDATPCYVQANFIYAPPCNASTFMDWMPSQADDGLIIIRPATNTSYTWMPHNITLTTSSPTCLNITVAYAATQNLTIFDEINSTATGNIISNHTNIPVNHSIYLWSVAYLTDGTNITTATRQYYMISATTTASDTTGDDMILGTLIGLSLCALVFGYLHANAKSFLWSNLWFFFACFMIIGVIMAIVVFAQQEGSTDIANIGIALFAGFFWVFLISMMLFLWMLVKDFIDEFGMAIDGKKRH